jgi:hypothetical protein
MTTITQSQFFGDAVAIREETWKEQVKAILAELATMGPRAVPPSSTRNQVVYARLIARRATELDLWSKLGTSLDPAKCEAAFVDWHIHADVPSAETTARRVREIEQEAQAVQNVKRRGWN